MTNSRLDVKVAGINQVYGSLTARVHAGYTLERAFADLEGLIKGDDWRFVGEGFDDINAFMDSVKLDQFRLIAEQRKRIVTRIKQLQPDISNRRIAKAIGTSDMTIGRDLATNVKHDGQNVRKVKEEKTKGATPDALNGWAAAKLVQRCNERKERIAAAAEKVRHISGEGNMECRLGDFRGVLADLRGIDAIITDPPYEKDFVPRLRDLAILADRILKPDGVMAILYGHTYLPEAFSQLAGYRPYRWTACYFMPSARTVCFHKNVLSQWKPLLVYGDCQKRCFDVFKSDLASARVGQEMHKWGQSLEGFKSIIEALTEPGDTIVDPCAGGGTTLLAAKATGRNAIGAEIDATCEVFMIPPTQGAKYEGQGARVRRDEPNIN